MDRVNLPLLIHKVSLHLPKDYPILIRTHDSLVFRSQPFRTGPYGFKYAA